MRIVVAMSGGVDSSVAAALLAEQGHDVIGLSMQLYDQRGGEQAWGTCCTLDDLHDARRVAAAIGFPHYIVNFERQFQRDGHLELRPRVRVGAHAAALRALQQRSEVLDAARARARAGRRAGRDRPLRARRARPPDGRWLLKRSADPAEGSVVLPVLADAGAARARGVSRRRARQVRGARARRAGLGWRSRTSPTVRRSASFPTATTRRSWSARRRTWLAQARFVDERGRQLGTHSGVHRFTIGQRKGLGVSSTIAALRAGDRRRRRNRHRWTARRARAARRLTASGVNWIAIDAPASPVRVAAQIRHRHKPAPGVVRALPDDRAEMIVRRAAACHHAWTGRRLLRCGFRRRRRVDRLELIPSSNFQVSTLGGWSLEIGSC